MQVISKSSLFHMKITASVTKSSHQGCDLCYLQGLLLNDMYYEMDIQV